MYRKLKAARLFDGYRLREGYTLIIDDHETIIDLLPDADAGGDAEIVEGLLMPGLVNCHCHLELSHMKGRIPEKTGLVDFVFKVVSERHHSESAIREAIHAGEEELLRNGTVAVGDICNNELTLEQKKRGRIDYYNFIESSGWLPSVADARFERALQLYRQYQALNTGNTSIVPHAPYSVSKELWSAIAPYFYGRTVSMHNQETAFEDEFFKEGGGDFLRMYELMKIGNEHHQPTGRSSLLSTFDHLLPAARILLVHNTFTQAADLENLNGRTDAPPVFFCLCPNANLYIEDRLPPVDLLRNAHCSIVLGTDSLASNWSLNILDEIRTLRTNFPHIPLEEMLQWATSNGARALGFEAQLGSFEKGKRPGLLSFNEKEWKVERQSKGTVASAKASATAGPDARK